MEISTLGIDLSKTSFHVIGLNRRGEIVLRKKLSRKQLLQFTSNRQQMLIGMEACGGAHFLSRALRTQGHDARLMPAQFVKAFVGRVLCVPHLHSLLAFFVQRSWVASHSSGNGSDFGQPVHLQIAFRPHLVAAPCRNLAAISISALFLSGKARTTRVRRRISRISRPRGLLVRRQRQCSAGNA
jgi:hypothetical protein